MKSLAPESPPSSATLLLPIRDLSQLFNAPLIDPLSPALPEVFGVSGVEYLLQQLEIKRPIKLTRVQVILPEGFSADVASQARNALRSYAETRIAQQRTMVRETRRNGWRLTGYAVLLLAFFLALSSLFASELTEGLRPLIRKTFEYGFEIIGWVMLWDPIEVLVFQPISIKSRIKALRQLLELEVAADVEGGTFEKPV